MQTISALATSEMAQIRNDIEYNYQNMTPEKTQELQAKLKDLANIFKVLNLNEAHRDLLVQADALSQAEVLKEESFAQQLMNTILSAMNSIGVLERHHTSSRLQLRVNNMHISLDRLDEAHEVLLSETKTLIDLAQQILVQHVQDQDVRLLENTCTQLREVAGALLFLNEEKGQQALLTAADFIYRKCEAGETLSSDELNAVLDTLAGADMLIDNLKNKQPVLQSMFDVALASSEKLKAVA